MPEGKISLEDGLADSPQVRAEVSKLEKYLAPFREYATLLRDTFQACSIHQEKVCEGTDALSKLLNSFQAETIGDEETFVPNAFFRLSRYLSELNSCQEMLNTQLKDAVIELLSQFISSDFNNLEKLKDTHKAASLEHEQASVKFSRCSKKRDSEKTRFEANAELFSTRKKFFESSLDYYSELNCFQHKRKFAILEPLLTFMHAQMAYFKVGHEILGNELANLLTGLNTEVQRVNEDYQSEVLTSAQTRAEIELRFHNLCLPDPDPADPFSEQPLLPDTGLSNKASYLFVRTQSGFPAKWDRAYFFAKKGHLYIHTPPKSPALIINLKEAEAQAADIDDKRYAFSINHSSLKRPIYLMAESELQRDEWIATVNNVGYISGHAQPRSNVKRDEAVIKLEREKIRHWVNTEIAPKKEKSAFPKLPKASPSPAPSPAPASNFPSISSFLSFLDPSNQSDKDNPPQRKSPISQRRTSSNPKPSEPGGGEAGSVPGHAHQPNKDLPSPLQPERLTAGAMARNQFSFSKTFDVKYLGHMEVPEGRNISMITDTIQKVMSARVLRNIKDVQAIEMKVTNKSICLYDYSAKRAIGQITLRDILRCAVQPDSAKLFGIVNRTSGDADKSKFICHVMEANTTGTQVCSAINEAIQAAIKLMQHARSKSSNIPVQLTRQQNKDSMDHSPGNGSLKQTPPTSSLPSKPPSRAPPPKPKSISDSSLLSVGGGFPKASSGLAPSSQSYLSFPASEDSVDGGTPTTPTTPGYLNAATPTLPSLLATVKPGAGLVGGPTHSMTQHLKNPGPNLSDPSLAAQQLTTPPPSLATPPPPMATPPPPMAAAAVSVSSYYQMPGSLQGGGVASDAFSDGDLDSPLPLLDDSFEPSDQFGGNPGKAAVGSIMAPPSSASMDSGYFQMPTMHSADTSSSQAAVGGGCGLADSGSGVTTSDGMGGAFDPAAGGGCGLGETLSSSDALFNVSSSSQKSAGLGSWSGGVVDSSSDSGYLPVPPVATDSAVLGGVANQSSAESVVSIGANFSNSWDMSGFPGSYPLPGMQAAAGTADLDDFELPPLPDSVEPPVVDSSSDSGYLPAPPVATDSAVLGGVANQSSAEPVVGIGDSLDLPDMSGFPRYYPLPPGMHAAAGEEDLDDFDLPPLPDSVEPPGQVGVASYGGSFVTFGTPRNN